MKLQLHLILLAPLVCSSLALPATITGGATTVALDGSFVSLVTGAGIAPAAVAPATLSGTTAMFPITGGDTTNGIINHSGGLSFTAGANSAVIENFVIDLPMLSLSGEVIANGGAPMMNVPLFNIETGNKLTITSSLAGDLTAVFGAPDLTGTSVGVATVSPITATPEPAAFTLVLLGLPLGLVLRRARKLR